MTDRIEWGGWVVVGGVVVGKPRVRLSPSELRVMLLLMAAFGAVVSRSTLTEGGRRNWTAVRTAVKTLRAALGKNAIATRRGHGVEGGFRLVRRDKDDRELDHMKQLVKDLEGVLARAKRILRAKIEEEGTTK